MRQKVEIACKTDTGMVRSENQDHFGIFEPADREGWEKKGLLVVVADGMGGHTGGTIASHTAIDAFLKAFRDSRQESMRGLLAESIQISNDAVRRRAEGDVSLRDMGTTCVALLIRGSSLMVGHLGDSRCYIVRKGRIEQLTRDHTYLNELIDMGLLTTEQADGHPDKNIITRCVGMAQKLEIDFHQRHLQAGDRFVLCSDGLTNMVRDEEIADAVQRHAPEEACRRMIDLANRRGGEDNITIAVISVVEPPDGPSEPDPSLEDTRDEVSPAVTPVIRRDQLPDDLRPRDVDPSAATPTSRPRPNIDARLAAGPVAFTRGPVEALTAASADAEGSPHRAWYWIIGAEIVILVLLQVWMSRL